MSSTAATCSPPAPLAEQARAEGCAWLHADFKGHLKSFYFDAYGFRPTNAGLIQLR